MANNWLMDWVIRMGKGTGRSVNTEYMPIRHLDGTVGPKTPWYLQPKSNPEDKVNSIGEVGVFAPKINKPAPTNIVPQTPASAPKKPVAQPAQQTKPTQQPTQQPVKPAQQSTKPAQTVNKPAATAKPATQQTGAKPAQTAKPTAKPTGQAKTGNTSNPVKKVPMQVDPKVQAIQKELIAAGYNLNKFGADGKWGKETENAFRLKQMQDSTKVKTEDEYLRERGPQPTTLPSISASSWRRNPGTLRMEEGGKFISNLIEKFKKGGAIKIKPENKGKFTATKKKTGKTTEELTKSKNPITKKRAVFAQNAAKWKHKDGGTINWDLSKILKIWTN